MRKKNIKLAAIATALIGFGLVVPSVSFAQSAQPVSVASGASSLPSVENGLIKRLGSLRAPLSRPDNILQGGQFYSKNASYHLKVGIKRYEKGDLEKSEAAFEAVLRSRDLQKIAYLYLAHINAKQGDRALELKYVEAYNSLPEEALPEWQGSRG